MPSRTRFVWRRSLRAIILISRSKTIWHTGRPTQKRPRQTDVKLLTTILAVVLMLGSVVTAQTTKKLPVQWTFASDSASVAPGGSFLAKLTAKIDAGWHMYSLTTPKGGGLPTIVKIDNPAVAGVKIYQPKPDKKFDQNFNVDTERYEGEVVFLAEVELAKNATAGPLEIPALIRYSA